MKRNMMISLVLSFVMIVGLCTTAFGGGGFEGQGCEVANLPLPTSGPYLYGIFTVARDQSVCSLYTHTDECRHYNVQAVLFRGTKIHLFSFVPGTSMGSGDLCNPDLEGKTFDQWLKDEFGSYPCTLEVGEAFGFDSVKYTPVIKKISIIIV